MEKKCNCGPDCKCGCQEGKECTCKDEKCKCGENALVDVETIASVMKIVLVDATIRNNE